MPYPFLLCILLVCLIIQRKESQHLLIGFCLSIRKVLMFPLRSCNLCSESANIRWKTDMVLRARSLALVFNTMLLVDGMARDTIDRHRNHRTLCNFVRKILHFGGGESRSLAQVLCSCHPQVCCQWICCKLGKQRIAWSQELSHVEPCYSINNRWWAYLRSDSTR